MLSKLQACCWAQSSNRHGPAEAVGNLPCSELANIHLNLIFNGSQVGYACSFCLASTHVCLGGWRVDESMAYSVISGFVKCGKNGVSAVNPDCRLAGHPLQEQKGGCSQSLLEFWFGVSHLTAPSNS